MWPFTRKPHLRYDSPEEWVAAEGISASFGPEADPAERQRRFEQLGELRQRLWARHIKTLPRAERAALARGEHPSQSHRFWDRAGPFAIGLHERLTELGLPAKTSLGAYHGDRIVLCADLGADPGPRASELPLFFRGFEVKYHWPPG